MNFITNSKDANEFLQRHRGSKANKCMTFRLSDSHEFVEYGYYPDDLRWICKDCGIMLKNSFYSDDLFTISVFEALRDGEVIASWEIGRRSESEYWEDEYFLEEDEEEWL